MGDRSDRQYHGVNDHREWTEGKRKPPEQGKGWQQRATEEAARAATVDIRELSQILTSQLPLFKKEGGDYRRTYAYDSFGSFSLEYPTKWQGSFALFKNSGILLDSIACSTNFYPDCTNLQDFVAKDKQMHTLYEKASSRKKDEITRKLRNKKAEVTVILTEEQFLKMKHVYEDLLEKHMPSRSP